jgi:hypothetical protein
MENAAMTIELLTRFLAWCSVVNIGLLMLWFIAVIFFKGLVFNLHNKLFSLSRETFNAIHYGGLGLYKLCIWMFNLTPYLVLQAIT